ncbi:uncharacterized protein LOC106178162 isoform X2 [Lingula anatina]|uniref:Uncharacterized protein LOC106178162 isoform X2 n=1 Tax=Lingula anatina TaxID=7574 RepID=A0A1S3K220_LINAN|nr:uncharacterized protein LOC106178162 isoform X2 [Lingula anatina]|eukprot:XP_013416683.1 uncharacterized protein LOC106178162 isoform X2 [Lingula anatina]
MIPYKTIVAMDVFRILLKGAGMLHKQKKSRSNCGKNKDVGNFTNNSYPPLWKELFSKDCFRFASFLGLYPALYNLFLKLCQNYDLKKNGMNYVISGGIAGLSLFVESNMRRRTIALFALARAVGVLADAANRQGVVRPIPHGYTTLFCLCCSFMVYCTALKPQLLQKGYYYSVLKWSRDYTNSNLEKVFRKQGSVFVSCARGEIHDNTCTRHAFLDLLQSWPGFAKLYLPIHVAPILLFKRKLLRQQPKKVLKSLLKNVVMSATFLSAMVMLAKYVICLLRNMSGKPPPLPAYIPLLAGLTCGLSVLFERASRRKELVMFLIPHTINALFLLGLEKGFCKYIPYGSVVVFAASMMPIMHAYEREPATLTPFIRGILRYFVS